MKTIYKLLLFCLFLVSCEMMDYKKNGNAFKKDTVKPIIIRPPAKSSSAVKPAQQNQQEAAPELVSKSTTKTKVTKIIKLPLSQKSLGKDPFEFRVKTTNNKGDFKDELDLKKALVKNVPKPQNNNSGDPYIEETTITTDNATVVRRVLKNSDGSVLEIKLPEEETTKVNPVISALTIPKVNANSGSTIKKLITDRKKTGFNRQKSDDTKQQLSKAQLQQLKYDKLPFDLYINPLYKKDIYKSDTKHTLVIEIEKLGVKDFDFDFTVLLPEAWSLISLTPSAKLKGTSKKLIFLTFNIQGNAAPGKQEAILFVKNNKGAVVKTKALNFKVAKNYSLEVFNISAPEYVQAGETIETTFGVRNIGNTRHPINLESKNSIEGSLNRNLAPDSLMVVTVTEKTNKRLNSISSIYMELMVVSEGDNTKKRSYKEVRVIPKRIKQKDPYLRFPVEASLLYNSYTQKGKHFSTLSAELRGSGYLDEVENHHLNFTFRGPKQLNLRRFGTADQYSVIYKYKDLTTVYLGDHGYRIDRLGFSNRYGMGFRLDQRINDFTLTAFYSKPRLNAFNNQAVYGAKAQYKINNDVNIGVSLSRSKKEEGYVNDIDFQNLSNVGQIITFNGNYIKKGTRIALESSTSLTKESVNTANFLSINQQYKNWNYNGNITIADKKYYGTLKNSIRFNSSLGYRYKKWYALVGARISRVNENLDTLYYNSQPYTENYDASLNYRLNRKHQFRLRLTKRKREDQMKIKNYYYKEYGVNYNYRFFDRKYSYGINGAVNNTKNLLALNSDYRRTYNNAVNGSVSVLNNFRVNGNFSHSFTNRYGNSDSNNHYFGYGAGLGYVLNPYFSVNTNYNSGFSPEDNYLIQNNFTFNMQAQIHNRHFLEIRSNYYQRPGSFYDKELFAFAKYTYRFGVPLKKVINQGGVLGNVNSEDASINVANIQIVAGGVTVVTDEYGNFELNNLNVGVNYIIVVTSSLQEGVMTTSKIPYEVTVVADEMSDLNITLMKTGGLKGKLQLQSRKPYSLKAYLKIFNDNYTYNIATRTDGSFQLNTLAPGVYNVKVINMAQKNELFDTSNNFKVEVISGKIVNKVFALKLKTRKIKFKSNNFNKEN